MLTRAVGEENLTNDFKKYKTLFSLISEKAEEIDGPNFLSIIEGLLGISGQHPRNHQDIDINFPVHGAPTADWTSEDDQRLAYDIFRFGLTKLPPDLHPEVDRDVLQRYAFDFVQRFRPEVRSSERSCGESVLTVADHESILEGLTCYGYPNREDFCAHIDVKASVEIICEYAESVITFCTGSDSEREQITVTFLDKISKYMTQKIPLRLELFNTLRQAATQLNEYAAEDIEFLTAIAFHGTANTAASPLLNISCGGDCTDKKLNSKIKTLLATPRRHRQFQLLPPDLSMPLRINDMLMVQDLGTIDPRPGFHNELYIYPLGYRCSCGCVSPMRPSKLIWIEAWVDELDDRPLFFAKNKKIGHPIFSGPHPSSPFEQIRREVQKRKGWPYFPPIDGHEMFGFTTAFVHKLLMELAGMEHCHLYQRRFFRSIFKFTNEWPKLGVFQPVPEQTPKVDRESKLHSTGVLPPLVLNFAQLCDTDPEIVLNVQASGPKFAWLLERHEKWDLNALTDACSGSDAL
jgi:hypothetical protein